MARVTGALRGGFVSYASIPQSFPESVWALPVGLRREAETHDPSIKGTCFS